MKESKPESTGRIGIDEFLAEAQRSGMTATVEPIADKPDYVKVTPWKPGGGCHCHNSRTVAKSAIEAVTPTGDVHFCCGKNHKVVEVHLKEGATVPISALFEAQEDHHHDAAPSAAGPRQRPRASALAAGVTCVCDHFINRFCGADGMLYETYWCYDDTGAYCGSETVPTGVSCSQTQASRAAMTVQSPHGNQGSPINARQMGQPMTRFANATPCDPTRQCDWGCCQPGQVACTAPGRGCFCCNSLADCYNGLC